MTKNLDPAGAAAPTAVPVRGPAPGPPDPAPDGTSEASPAVLRAVVGDDPDLLPVMTCGLLRSVERPPGIGGPGPPSGGPVFQFCVGRARSGKTTLGTLLFGEAATAPVGFQEHPDAVGCVRLNSHLCYVDTPGGGSSQENENVARLALGLPRHALRPAIDSFRVLDRTATAAPVEGRAGETVEGRFHGVAGQREFAARYPPDVVVYVVVPHRLFQRDDRDYLRDVLKRYGEKVVIALNRWTGIDTDLDVDDVRGQIESVYRHAHPDGSVTPRLAVLDLGDGTGLDALAALLCEVVAPEKLAAMAAVLKGDLKRFAVREHSRRYRG